MQSQKSIKSTKTKKRLLDAAFTEFNQSGYFDTCVDTITQKAGVSHGTFYLYFKNKNDVLTTLLKHKFQKIPILNSEKKTSSEWVSAENLNDFEAPIIQFIKTLSVHPGLLKSFLQGMVQDKSVFECFNLHSTRISKIFIHEIKRHQKEGRFPGYNAKVISQIMAITLLMSAFLWAMGIIRCNQEQLATNIANMLYALLSHEKRLPLLVRSKNIPKQKNKKQLNKTKRCLINAAKDEFAARGYFDTKISDISKRAGCSRGIFYNYFTGKDDIMQTIYQEMVPPLNPANIMADNAIYNLDPTNLDDVEQVCASIVKIFQNIGPLNLAFLQGSFHSDTLYDTYWQTFNYFSGPIIDQIDKLKQKGKCQRLDSTISAYIMLTTVGYTTFLFYTGFINCKENDLTVNLAKFLYNLLNYEP